MVPAAYLKMLQEVIIKDTVIDALAGGTFAVCLSVFHGIPWDAGMEAEVAVVLYVDGAPIGSVGAFFCMGAGIYAATFQRTAVFVRILYWIVAPWAHFIPGRTEGMPGFVESDVCRGVF